MALRITSKMLHECFSYDPDTGVLTWRRRPQRHFLNDKGYKVTNSRMAGRPAGSCRVSTDREDLFYVTVGVFNRLALAHRIVWSMVYGMDLDSVPKTIDHIDARGENNRLNNLRVATLEQNSQNQRIGSGNTTGFKGVIWHKATGKFMAQIGADHKHYYLGCFDDPEMAHEAYKAAAARLHGEFARWK